MEYVVDFAYFFFRIRGLGITWEQLTALELPQGKRAMKSFFLVADIIGICSVGTITAETITALWG